MKLNGLFSQPLGSVSSHHAVKKEMPIPLAIPIAMAGASLVSSIFGGASSSAANRRAMAEAERQKSREDALLRRRRNEYYIDSEQGQNLLRKAREIANDNWMRESGRAAVTGASDAAAAVAKEAGNKMVGDTIADIAATDAARRDGVDAEQLASDRAHSQQIQAYEQQRGQAVAQAASGVSDALAQGAALTFANTKLGGGNNGGKPAPKTTSTTSSLFKPDAFWQRPSLSNPFLGNARFSPHPDAFWQRPSLSNPFLGNARFSPHMVTGRSFKYT